MIRIHVMLLSLIFCALTACSKKTDNTQPTPSGTGVNRPQGQSLGDVTEKTIGVEGGKIQSEDGQVEIIIPAGALTKETTIGIEPVSRTLVDRSENEQLPAYRLTPHNQQFQKPATIRFHYSIASLANIAYQDDKGKWRGMPNLQKDESAKTVSVQSTHFSDWTTYESIYLEPKEPIMVEVGKTLHLKVMTVTPMGLTEEDQANKEYYLDEPSPIPAPVDWRIVNGPGNGTILNVPTRATGIFTAPATLPLKNPVEVEAKVTLKTKGNVLLFANITITEPVKPGIDLKINGGPWIHFSDESFMSGQSYFASDGDFPYDRHSLYIRIEGGKAKGTGTWAWNDQPDAENPTTFEYIAKQPAPRTTYEHRFMNNPFDIWHMSPGFIRITAYAKDAMGDTWATGEFLIEKSTPYIEDSEGFPPPSRLEGKFKLRVD